MTSFPGEIIDTAHIENGAIFKQCVKCDQWKSIANYHKKKRGKFGVDSRCVVCVAIYKHNRDRSSEVKAREAERHRKNYSDPAYRLKVQVKTLKRYCTISGRANALLRTARRSNASQTTACTVTLEHIVKGIEAGICPVTGFRFELSNQHRMTTLRKADPYAPSLDRIDARKGYTNENTRIVIWQYNMAKGETTDAEMLRLCRAVVENAFHFNSKDQRSWQLSSVAS